jgi:formylglycine-generating enzyme required for sulfatase activity
MARLARLSVALSMGLSLGGHLASRLEAAMPEVTNVRAAQRPGTKLVDIYYDLSDADGNTSTIWVLISSDSGATWNVPARSFSGDWWARVKPGPNKHIVWNAGEDWDGQFTTRCRARVMADDQDIAGAVLIPAGPFQMGDTFAEGGANERPVHTVSVSAFYLDKTVVTKMMWDMVYGWAVVNGYGFDNRGGARGPAHPVHSINWYDAVKWCNARSQLEGRTPAYYTDASQATVYKTGRIDLGPGAVKWTANGYRLPTEAEWEKAARGGLAGKRFPWGNTITHNQANYYSSSNFAYDTSQTRGCHPDYGEGTSPVGSFAPNDFGLFDMAGNLWEWCWDWHDGSWYGKPEATSNDTRGPPSGTYRVLRGGAWHSAYLARCACHNYDSPADYYDYIGLRCGRGQ